MTVLAIDFGGSHVSCAVVRDAQVLITEHLPVSSRETLRAILPSLAEALRSAATTANVAIHQCDGVAISFCGLVNPYLQTIIATNGKYEDAIKIDLVAWANDEFALPLRLENDARMALLGERYAGAAQGFDDVVMFTLGTGIGGATMMKGRLVHGRHFQAGCLGGHLLARIDGRECTCGNIGCVEAEASSWILPQLCREHPGYSGSSLAELREIGFRELLQHDASGDKCAREVLEKCMLVWAAGVVSLIHAYDPEIVVVGGGVMNSYDRILPGITDYVHAHAWTPWGKVQVRAATLGNAAGLVGAIPLFMEPHHE
jgi:glucokinase